jgi:hypothetical protein
VVAVGCTGLFVVVKTKSCGFIIGVLGLSEPIVKCGGAGVHIVPVVSVLVSTETVMEHLFLASRANTFNFKSLNVSNISLGNGMPYSCGHSHRSLQLCLSSCLRGTVSGSHHCGAVVAVMGL